MKGLNILKALLSRHYKPVQDHSLSFASMGEEIFCLIACAYLHKGIFMMESWNNR